MATRWTSTIDRPLIDRAMPKPDYVVTEHIVLPVPAEEAFAAVDRYRVHALPVVDDDHRVLGIVSEADLSRSPRAGRARRVRLPGHRRRWRARAGKLWLSN